MIILLLRITRTIIADDAVNIPKPTVDAGIAEMPIPSIVSLITILSIPVSPTLDVKKKYSDVVISLSMAFMISSVS
jgi:hypothetical protein